MGITGNHDCDYRHPNMAMGNSNGMDNAIMAILKNAKLMFQ